MTLTNQVPNTAVKNSAEEESPRSLALKSHHDAVASHREQWISKNTFYHKEIRRYCRFFVPEQSSVLQLGCMTGDLLAALSPAYGVGVDISPKMIEKAKAKYPHLEFVCSNVERFKIDKKFDYVILSGTLGTVENIQKLLQQLSGMMSSDTRVIITYYNELWGPIIRLGEKMKLKMPEIIYNWLSLEDIENFLNISGYQVIRRDFLMLLPVKIPLVTNFFNKIIGMLPILRRLTLTHCVVARPYRAPDNSSELTSSVVLTCRDEEENIEGLVTSIPAMGRHTEIIFVEGHSQDNTVGKIEEMIKKYPDKDIKLYKQKGIGQGDAFRLGFDQAQGDFVCWLEADLTINPQEIAMFWDAFITGKGEYINGTRFIYEMEKRSMPLVNFVGNRFFGNIFTPLLGQRFTDTLCGFKAISKKNYLKIRKQIDFFGDFDPFGDFELIFGAIKSCLKVAEIPVHYRPRQYGSSKAYGKSFLSFLKHAWLLIKMSWIAFIKFKLN
jgi:SAM-dependent methyltransferase